MDGTRLEMIALPGSTPLLSIQDDVSLEQDVQIVCASKVIIRERVTIAPRCFITDVSHPYQDIEDHNPIRSRLSHSPRPVEIGEESFLGVGSVILPGVSLGRRCIVGANSVVTHSMPDYCVCAGAPARVIKNYDPLSNAWVSVEE
jgi:acetyltransferase-like isoleucine patch superfamily enzyme